MLSHTTVRPVYAGIDFHKKTIMVALGDQAGALIGKPQELPTDIGLIRKFFAAYPGIQCVIENCRGFDWLVELLLELGAVVHISNPYKTRMIAENTCKTDKIDAKILMQLLAKDYLPTCYRPSADEVRLKERLRWRKQIVGSSTRFKNRATALLDKENKGHDARYSAIGRAAISTLALKEHRQELVREHLDLIHHLEESRSREDRWVSAELAKTPQAALLLSIPGFGEVTALTIFSELGDVKRFPNSNNVTAYLGLNPRLYSSAKTRRLGSITKKGSAEPRALLVQASWTAIRKSTVLKNKFLSIAKRRGKKIAIVAIARLLAEIAYHILRTGEPYNESKLALG